MVLGLASPAAADTVTIITLPAESSPPDWISWLGANDGVLHQMEEDTTADRVDSAGTNCSGPASCDVTPDASISRTSSAKRGSFALNKTASARYLDTTDTFFDMDGTSGVDFTAGCWVYPTANQRGDVMSKYDDSNDGWYIELRTSAPRLACNVDNGAAVSGNNVWSLNTWFHAACRFDQSAGSDNITVFADGVANGTRTEDTMGTTVAHDFTIGNEANGQNQGFAGRMDECFFVKRVLTADSICRVTSCGWDGALCKCAGGDPTTYSDKGDNVSSCLDSVTEDCNAASPGTL